MFKEILFVTGTISLPFRIYASNLPRQSYASNREGYVVLFFRENFFANNEPKYANI
jgi:hypothetical protein